MGLSDAKSPDAQAGLEAATGLLLAGLAGVNVVSGAGMLDFESCQSLEKLVIDNDVCGMAYRLLQGVTPRHAPLGLEVIRDVGHQSGFLDHPHTRQWYRAEQSVPRILDRGTYDAWVASGCEGTATRASKRVQALLEGPREPLLDPPSRRMLRAVMAGHARRLNAGALPFSDPEAESPH
jgi:trimethylamine--corrinoid protein Co-methyltransferase